MKKYFKYISIAVMMFSLCVANVSAASNTGDLKLSNICNDSATTVRTMRLLGYLLLVAKILIPIILLGVGVYMMFNAMMNGEPEAVQSAAKKLIWKFIAAVIVFLLPSFINTIFQFVEKSNEKVADYDRCRVCILDPSKCVIPNSKI